MASTLATFSPLFWYNSSAVAGFEATAPHTAVPEPPRNPPPGSYAHQPTYVAHLPVVHFMTELLLEMVLLHRGFRLCYGATHTLLDNHCVRPRCDVVEYNPTMLLGVPAIFQSLCALIESSLRSGGWSRRIFDLSFELRRQALRRSFDTPYLNRTAFQQPRHILGERCTAVLSIAAPLSAGILEFLVVVCGVAVHQVYGLKESAACGLWQSHGQDVRSNVGGPMGPVEVKVRPCPGLLPASAQPGAEPLRGELLLRGPTRMCGYQHQVQRTMDVLEPPDEEEGDETGNGEGWWLRTGDVVERSPHDGTFRILGPLKNVFKNSCGISVCVEMLEQLYSEHPVCANSKEYYYHSARHREHAGSTGGEGRPFPAPPPPSVHFNTSGAPEGSSVCIVLHPHRSYLCALVLTTQERSDAFVRRDILRLPAGHPPSAVSRLDGGHGEPSRHHHYHSSPPPPTGGLGGFAWPHCLREARYHQAVAQSLNARARRVGGILSHERLRHCRVLSSEAEAWTRKNLLRTATGRLCRQRIVERYQHLIDEMFREEM